MTAPCRDYDPNFKLDGCELGAGHDGPHRTWRGYEWDEHLDPQPGRCDSHAPWGSGYPDQRCVLGAGHVGAHRDRSGNEWGEPAPAPAPAPGSVTFAPGDELDALHDAVADAIDHRRGEPGHVPPDTAAIAAYGALYARLTAPGAAPAVTVGADGVVVVTGPAVLSAGQLAVVLCALADAEVYREREGSTPCLACIDVPPSIGLCAEHGADFDAAQAYHDLSAELTGGAS